MKKLIAAMALALSIAANASTVSWGLTDAVNTTTFASGTAYLVFTTGSAITSFDSTGLASFTIGDVLRATDTQVASGTVSAGLIQADDTTFSASTGRNRKFYSVIINDSADSMMISSILTGTISTSDSSAVALKWSAAEMGDVYTISSTPPTPPTPAVPEPTSGVLMLVGMGVLALRRKRA